MVVVVKGVGKEERKGEITYFQLLSIFFQVSSIQRKALH